VASRELEDVLEVDEDPLRRLRTQVRLRSFLLDRADRRLEHQVELPRLGQVAVRRLARVLRRLPSALRGVELVFPEAQLARPAVDERVGEPSTWPEASQTRGWRMIAESIRTMSSRSCTIASSQRWRMLFFVSTP
jgi:hypothetical protein